MVENFSEEELKRLRLKASTCWHIAGKLGTKDSPLVAGIISRIEEFMSKDPGREFSSMPTKEELGATCDELILVPDASTRVMTLRSMWFLRYRSVQLGFISTLLSSRERGDLISSGEVCGNEIVGWETAKYLARIFNFREFLLVPQLERSIGHWESVLRGYAKDYFYPKESFNWRHSFLRKSLKTIKREACVNYRDSLRCFANDIRGIISNLGLTDIAKKREVEIKEDLIKILRYNFSAEQSPLVTIVVLEELGRLSESAFPSEWLIEIIEKMLPVIDFSSQLKNLLVV